MSSELFEEKRERLREKASKPLELVAISPKKPDWKRHSCAATTGFLMKETFGPTSINCVRLRDLVFLPAGDVGVTRLVKARSKRSAVVAVPAAAAAATKGKGCSWRGGPEQGLESRSLAEPNAFAVRATPNPAYALKPKNSLRSRTTPRHSGSSL